MNPNLIVVLICALLAAAVNSAYWLARRRNRWRQEHMPVRNCALSWPGLPGDGRPLDDYEKQKLQEIAAGFHDNKEATR